MRRLGRLIHERGYSKAETARRAGMHPATVGAILNGRIHPYPSQLKKLARALGLPGSEAESLMEEVE